MNWSPYNVVSEFEKMIAEWTGAPYAVAVESGSAAIFLCLQWYNKDKIWDGLSVNCPAQTYPSVPCSIIHSRMKVTFYDYEWEGEYRLWPTDIWDSALRFKKDMYRGDGAMQCLSFHIKKRLPIGRGGMILLDNEEAYEWLKRARFDGRNPVPLQEDNFTQLGWNVYMEPTNAARGIQLFHTMKDKDLPDLPFEEQKYASLSKFNIYQQ